MCKRDSAAFVRLNLPLRQSDAQVYGRRNLDILVIVAVASLMILLDRSINEA